MVGVTVNGDSNGNSQQLMGGAIGAVSGSNNGNNPTGPSHYSAAGSSNIGSNNMDNHNKPVSNGGIWGAQSGGSMATTAGSTTCINGGLNQNTLNPNANFGAWLQNPSPGPGSQGQRSSQAQGSSKLGLALQQGAALGWGGMAAPNKSSATEEDDATNGTANSKVLGSSSGSGGLPPTNLNTESNGPNNTIMMNTTTITTNATMTSSPPNSTGSPKLGGDDNWGSIGAANGGSVAAGNSSLAPQQNQAEQGGPGSFSTPWGTTTYPGDKGHPNADTVNPPNPALMQAGNPQISSTAAYKSNNNQTNTAAPRWDQGPTNNTNQSQSNLSWGYPSNQLAGPQGQTSGNCSQTAMGPPAGIPRPWGSSASSSSSSSSSSSCSTSNNKMSNGDWGSTALGANNPDAENQKGNAGNSGWKSLEDDAIGMGGGGGHGLGSVAGVWGRSGGSEGSGESSGGRSSSDRDTGQSKGGLRRKGAPSVLPVLPRGEMDPRVLSNTGWGQTPIRQNSAWDVSSANNQPQRPRGDERKQSSGGSSWGTATPTPSQPSGGQPQSFLIFIF